MEFTIEKVSFGTGGFRNAFKATSHAQYFRGTTCVVKKYLPKAKETIQATNQTLEQHTQKVVQMHMLAKNFSSKLEQQLQQKDCKSLYGNTLTFKKIYLGVMEENEYVTV